MKLAPGESKGGTDFAHAAVAMLARLGVGHAFGVIGGTIAPFAHALEGAIELVHCRHEAGAAFAAAECSLASGKPVAVFTTTGPGLVNALNGLVAAKWEGARVVLVSSTTSPPVRGRGAFQETGFESVPPGWFDYSAFPHSVEELATIHTRLRAGFERPNGFVANLSLSRALQLTAADAHEPPGGEALLVAASRPGLGELARTLADSRFVIWLGHGARGAAEEIRALAARSRAPVMSSPRGKGIFPETSRQYLGVTGLGGDDLVEHLRAYDPAYTLVLGSRLGEFTSFWDPALLPSKAIVHVDVNDAVFGAAYPQAVTHGIRCEVGDFVQELLRVWPHDARITRRPPRPTAEPFEPSGIISRRESGAQRISRPIFGKVRPSVLMEAIQRGVVEGTDAIVMTEAGNAFAWGSASLRFDEPRYRVSTGWGSMGQAAAGVLGAAIGSGRKAVAILGDGAMLMQSEVSTAVQYGIPAVWIVLNDGRYGMIEGGMRMEGLEPRGTSFPQVDFVSFAKSMGAHGERVSEESELESAIFRAMAHPGPFVLDVVIDPDQPAPIGQRIAALKGHEA